MRVRAWQRVGLRRQMDAMAKRANAGQWQSEPIRVTPHTLPRLQYHARIDEEIADVMLKIMYVSK